MCNFDNNIEINNKLYKDIKNNKFHIIMEILFSLKLLISICLNSIYQLNIELRIKSIHNSKSLLNTIVIDINCNFRLILSWIY